MRLIVTKDQQSATNAALEVLHKVIQAFQEGHQYKTEEKETTILANFFGDIEVSVGTSGELDTVLMKEIGKAYQAQYLEAQESGDKEAELRFYGAMFATKKIMDMLQEPAF